MVLIHDYSDLVCKKIIINKSKIHSEKFKTQSLTYKIKNKKVIKFENIYFQI